MSPKASRFAISALLVLLCALSPALSQKITFDPELELGALSNDNVRYAPEGEEDSDTSFRVRLLLPVVREWAGGRLQFSYEPSYEKYSDNSDLDHDSHNVELSLRNEPSPRSELDYTLSFNSSQRQGRADSISSPDLVVVPRLDRQLLETDISFSRQSGRRTHWVLAAGASDYSYSSITDVGLPPEVEDRRTYRGTAGLHWTRTRTSTLGFEAGYQIFDLEGTGEENIASLSLVWTREFARGSEMEARLGGFNRDREAEDPMDPILDESGFQGEFRLTKSMRTTSFSFIALRAPSPGGTLAGTSTDTAGQIILEGDPGPRWHWAVSGRYSKREPTTAGFPEVDSTVGSASLEWRPNRRFGVRMSLDNTDQSATVPEDDISVFTAHIGAVWYPKGQR